MEPVSQREPKTVLITGGSRGIGLACARAFEADGHRVAVTYVTKPVDDLFCVRCDVSQPGEVDAAFAEVEEQLGPVQILVANAGITRDQLTLRMKDEDFTAVLDTNLTGAWRVAKKAAASMLRARWGRLIFMSSASGFFGAPGQANYAAAKAGMVGLARSLARELASRNITANVVAPGPIATDMTEVLTDAQREGLVGAVPLGRMGTADEVAAAVRFLASEEAAYITGAVVPVDGGLAMGH